MPSPAVANDPHAEYSARLNSLRLQRTSFDARHRQLGTAKILAASLFVLIIIWALKSHSVSILWLFPPVLAFALLEMLHLRVLRSWQLVSRSIVFYERGLARLQNRWMGSGETGDRFLDPSHPYARDLDIFGAGSLFELICTARTTAGQEILSRWLLSPAAPDEVLARQTAVTELRPRLDLREDLAVFGESLRSSVHPLALTAWAEAPPILQPRASRVLSLVLAVSWIFSMAAWAVWGLWPLALASSVLNSFFNSHFKSRVDQIAPAERFAPELGLLAGALARLEREKFSSPKLLHLQSALNEEGLLPSHSLAKVRRLLESLESRRNLAITAINPFVLWNAQLAFAIESWRQKFGPALRHWLAAVGEMEALAALAGYTYEHPTDVFPEFSAAGVLFEAEGFAHPLLPESHAVRNDLTIGEEMRLLIISGPNMAGKSTFIRAVGINAVLAQCGAPVRARRLRLSPLQVAASICILDSLQGGVSRFYAEIIRLKLISELTTQSLPVLFLLDELLNGTNSHDRRIGAEAVVKSLVAKHAVGLVTTHDLALTHIVDDLSPRAANFHFEDRLENSELRFDYRLTPGIAHTSNALKLMRSIGLDV